MSHVSSSRFTVSLCRARAALLGIAVLAVTGLTGCSAQVDAPPLAGKNLLLITCDTTRADYVSCYGGAEGLTPRIDRLAAEGVLFEEAYSQTNITNPSHVSILSGLYAIQSEVLTNFMSIPDDVDILPAMFQRAGYATGGFPSAPQLSKTLLDLPGFDMIHEVSEVVDAEDNVDRAIAWLDESGAGTAGQKPFFMWLHFYDPHTPYDPPAEFRQMFYQGDPQAGDGPTLSEDPFFRASIKPVQRRYGKVRDREYPVAMYSAEIAYMDHEIGRFLDYLESRGTYDDTAVVLVADHGEVLGEHGVYYDHVTLYEPSIKIPFIVRAPGVRQGVRVPGAVTHVDIVPTVSGLFGLTPEQDFEMHGMDLGGVLAGSAEVPSRLLVHEHASNQMVSLREGPWKLTKQIDAPKFFSPPVQLTHLGDDPSETTNVVDAHPDLAEKFGAVAREWVERPRPELGPGEQNPAWDDAGRERLAKLRKQLAELGYVEEDDEASSETDGGEAPASAAAGGATGASGQFVGPQRFYERLVACDDIPFEKRRTIYAMYQAWTRKLRQHSDSSDQFTALAAEMVAEMKSVLTEAEQAVLDGLL